MLIGFELTQRDDSFINFANNSLLLTSLDSSGRVNHYGGLAEQLVHLLSLEQCKGGWLAPLHCLEGLLHAEVPVALRLWRYKQLGDSLLRGGGLSGSVSVLLSQKALIDSVKIFFRQFFVGAVAKGVNCVDAAVIERQS